MTEVYANDPNEIAGEISKLLRLAGPLRTVSREQANTAEYQDAIAAYDKALRETVRYMEKVNSGNEPFNQSKEANLSQLWSEASIAISKFDPDLANRCFIKGQGWLNPAVWKDPRYKQYHIGIDDMREALMDFNEKQFALSRHAIPKWFPIAGAGFAIATFLSLFYLLLGADLSEQKKIIFDTWIAFCVAASTAFLGGTAVAAGTLKLPFMKKAPVKFSAIGGIAIFLVVLILMATLNR